MSLHDLFLKSDHTGRRSPTILTILIVSCVVFVAYYASSSKADDSDENRRESSQILDGEDLQRARARLKPRQQDLFTIPEAPPEPPKTDMKRLYRKNSSPMIVFDNTKDITSDYLVPYGSIIKCVLIHNIITNDFSAPVIAQVWEDFYFGGDKLIPQGTRIYGTAAPGHERDRVLVKFHTIVFQDGETLNSKAIGLSEDGSAGLTGIVITDRNKKVLISMITNFLSAFALGLQDTYTNQVTGGQNIDMSARNASLEGVGSTFEKEADRIHDEVMNSKGYAIVSAGTQLGVYFEETLDVKPY